jgi:uncharacterized protein YkwD
MRYTISRSVQILLPVMLTLLLVATFFTSPAKAAEPTGRQFTIDPIEREATRVTTTYETYEVRMERGTELTQHINYHRTPSNLALKSLLVKAADIRSGRQADERDASGTSEFPHNLGVVQEMMDQSGWCYSNVGEVVGFSNTLDTSTVEATAVDITHRWMESDIHWPLLNGSRYNWGGGSWVRSQSGTYFFAYYVVDPC